MGRLAGMKGGNWDDDDNSKDNNSNNSHQTNAANGGNEIGKERKNGRGSRQSQQQQPRQHLQQSAKPKTEYIQKYSAESRLLEAIIIGNKPHFAVVDSSNKIEPTITLDKGYRLDERTLLKPESMCNRPYFFKSEKEFEECLEKARNETLDSLYNKVLVIWRKYIDADDFHLKICTADTMFTYKQDMIGMTHYLFFVADNDAGKSNNLTMFNFLAYRNLMSNNMTYANIYYFLGNRDEGVGSICEDEAYNIDINLDKMGIYKEGYTKGHPVYRIIDTANGKRQVKLNTFCFKAFAAERLPDAIIGRGFLQRTIVLKCLPGFPQYDISEVANPGGDTEFQELLDELNELHNLLFCYFRLLHYNDVIPNIRLNIRNREKQLFKPILRMFQGTRAFHDLLPVIEKYISYRRQDKVDSFHAFLYRLIRDLIASKGMTELESSNIWNSLKERVDYKEIPFKPQSIETVEFGVISYKAVIQTLKEVFHAAPPKHKGNDRRLIFSQDVIDRMTDVYDIDIEIKVEEGLNEDFEAHGAYGAHSRTERVGLDRHFVDDQSYSDKANQSTYETKTHSEKAPQAPQAPQNMYEQ